MQERSGLISLAVPCFNERKGIQHFVETLTPVLETLGHPYEILFVDDGSTDDTLAILTVLANTDPRLKVIGLTRNFGKEAALTAALDFVSGDAVIPMDADLQDPVELVPRMVARWEAGAEIVLAHRQARPGDSAARRWAARRFYRIISRLSAIPIPADVGDFRLMDRKVVECVRQLPEKTRFMKGILAWPGFHSETLEFTRPPRQTGGSKWPLWKLFNFALDGIFSFSTAPLRVWTYLGVALSLFSLGYLLWVVGKTLLLGVDVPGYASTLSVILFFNGIILIGLGILGEYLGRVFVEVKGRPVYLVKSTVGFRTKTQPESGADCTGYLRPVNFEKLNTVSPPTRPSRNPSEGKHSAKEIAMQALLIIAHGSRRPESNDEIRALAHKIARQSGDTYGYVGSAFLELAEPSIPDGVQHCIEQGATTITIMPFFLSAGRHVVTDVPELVRAKQREHPHIQIRMAPYLGVSPLMPSLILQSAAHACDCDGDGCSYPACLKAQQPE